MKAVILAGGLGTRLLPLTEVIPKPLLPVGDKAILEIQIEHLKKFGVEEIILATNFKSTYIENFFGNGSRYGVKLSVSKENKPLGTCGPLTLLKDRLTEPFLVIYGDILTTLDFGKFSNYAQDKDAILTLAIKKIITHLDFGEIEFKGDRVVRMSEKPCFFNYIATGIYYVKPEVIDFVPDNSYFGMDDLITELLLKEKMIVKYEMQEYWLDIGRDGDYQKAQQIYQNYLS